MGCLFPLHLSPVPLTLCLCLYTCTLHPPCTPGPCPHALHLFPTLYLYPTPTPTPHLTLHLLPPRKGTKCSSVPASESFFGGVVGVETGFLYIAQAGLDVLITSVCLHTWPCFRVLVLYPCLSHRYRLPRCLSQQRGHFRSC
jgi:hypothetical protein